MPMSQGFSLHWLSLSSLFEVAGWMISFISMAQAIIDNADIHISSSSWYFDGAILIQPSEETFLFSLLKCLKLVVTSYPWASSHEIKYVSLLNSNQSYNECLNITVSRKQQNAQILLWS